MWCTLSRRSVGPCTVLVCFSTLLTLYLRMVYCILCQSLSTKCPSLPPGGLPTAQTTDTRHRHSSAQANGGAPAAGWHPLRTYLSRTDAKGQVVAKTHDDVGSPARSPAGATAPPCPCLCKEKPRNIDQTDTLKSEGMGMETRKNYFRCCGKHISKVI